MTKKEFLKEKIFYDLTNLNTGFDSASIEYFSSKDFKIVLERVKKQKIGIHGIETWKNENFFEADGIDDPFNYKAQQRVFEKHQKMDDNLLYSATYFISENNHD
jgi:hypothetical protein